MQTSDSSACSPSFDVITLNCTPLSVFDAIMKDLISSLQCLTQHPFDTAITWVGTPYHPQASLKGIGCDCVGLIKGIWNEIYQAPVPSAYQTLNLPNNGLTPYQTIENIFETLFILKSITTVGAGDIMLFRMTSKGHAHTGIYTPSGGIIHALEKSGVVYEKTLPLSLKKRWISTYGWR